MGGGGVTCFPNKTFPTLIPCSQTRDQKGGRSGPGQDLRSELEATPRPRPRAAPSLGPGLPGSSLQQRRAPALGLHASDDPIPERLSQSQADRGHQAGCSVGRTHREGHSEDRTHREGCSVDRGHREGCSVDRGYREGRGVDRGHREGHDVDRGHRERCSVDRGTLRGTLCGQQRFPCSPLTPTIALQTAVPRAAGARC